MNYTFSLKLETEDEEVGSAANLIKTKLANLLRSQLQIAIREIQESACKKKEKSLENV